VSERTPLWAMILFGNQTEYADSQCSHGLQLRGGLPAGLSSGAVIANAGPFTASPGRWPSATAPLSIATTTRRRLDVRQEQFGARARAGPCPHRLPELVGLRQPRLSDPPSPAITVRSSSTSCTATTRSAMTAGHTSRSRSARRITPAASLAPRAFIFYWGN